MAKFKKGSAAAKRHMAKLRRMRGKSSSSSSFKRKTRATKQRVTKRKKTSKVRPMAKKRRRSSPKRRVRRRKSSGKIGNVLSKNTLLLGVGAGASGVLGGYVQKYAPQIPNNYAEAAAGLALVMFGGKIAPEAKVIGKGVMIKVIGDFVEQNVMPKVLSGSTGAGASDNF